MPIVPGCEGAPVSWGRHWRATRNVTGETETLARATRKIGHGNHTANGRGAEARSATGTTAGGGADVLLAAHARRAAAGRAFAASARKCSTLRCQASEGLFAKFNGGDTRCVAGKCVAPKRNSRRTRRGVRGDL